MVPFGAAGIGLEAWEEDSVAGFGAAKFAAGFPAGGAALAGPGFAFPFTGTRVGVAGELAPAAPGLPAGAGEVA